MCKMLFIGVQEKLQVIQFDKEKSGFHIEEISGELLPIREAFSNNNVYFVGTSRGCGCDFGIQSNKRDPISIEQRPPIQNIVNTFRKISGTFEEWRKRQQEKVANAIEAQANYLTQTLKLVDIILNETKKGNTVEMFCVLAGEYDATPEFPELIDTKKSNLREYFDIAEGDFATFM